jgi:hypothetical protein
MGCGCGEGEVREMEKPKVLGWSLKRRVRIVDFPLPEGPEITIGRWDWVAASCRMVRNAIKWIVQAKVPVGAIVA